MKRRMAVLWALAVCIRISSGQTSPIEGETSVTLSADWVETGSITVGSNSANNALIIPAPWSASSEGGLMGYAAAASNNTVSISGAGAGWTVNDLLSVGYYSSGNALNISTGGVLSAADVVFGGDYEALDSFGASQNVLWVRGAGARADVSGDLTIGDTGSNNECSVSNGGRVEIEGVFYIGYETTANENQVAVADLGSALQADEFYIGFYGASNQLTVREGATVSSGVLAVGVDIGSDNNSVEIRGAGAVWTNTDVVEVGVASNQGNELQLADGGQLITQDLIINAGHALAMELGSGEMPNLRVTGSADLDGTLRVSFAPGYSPSGYAEYELFDWGSIAGAFATVELPTLSSGLLWNTNDLYTGGAIAVVSAADLDHDGMPDEWENQYFGSTTNAGPGDTDAFSDLEEYIAGTDPTNAASYFSIAYSEANPSVGFILEWGAETSRYYTIRRQLDLAEEGSVTTLQDFIEFPQNRYTDSVERAESFYRVDVRLK